MAETREGIPVPDPEPTLRAPDGLASDPALLEVVRVQLARDADALQELLRHPEPRVRARAAHAAGSVQDPDLIPQLVRLLEDPEGAVRRDAAFALGQMELADGGRALLDALDREAMDEVRLRLLEAVGKRGDPSLAAERLLALDGAPRRGATAYAYYLALSRIGIRAGPQVDTRLVDALASALDDPQPEVRRGAAYSFRHARDASAWRDHAGRLREILDGLAPADPLAGDLIRAVARLRSPDDGERLRHWLESAEDWRTRVDAALAMVDPRSVPPPEVRDALWRTVRHDDSEHAATAAALALSAGLIITDDVIRAAADWLREDMSRWRSHVPLLRMLAMQGEYDHVLAWLRRAARVDPAAAAMGLGVVSSAGTDYPDLLAELADHPDPWLQSAALARLGDQWYAGVRHDGDLERFFSVFQKHLRGAAVPAARRSAAALLHPGFHPLGAAAALLEAYDSRQARTRADTLAQLGILQALGIHGDPTALELLEEKAASPDPWIRNAAATAIATATGTEAVAGGTTDQRWIIDAQTLRDLGPAPRLVLETDAGTLVFRLLPEEAPLTVQTVAALAAAGDYDGTLLHRGVPATLVQGGDFLHGDGSGHPGWTIPSEFTQLPFRRGVIGMASAGKDTESSQFFVTHSRQHHLDGRHTAFGWLISGEDVLDRLHHGHRILRARVEAGPGDR